MLICRCSSRLAASSLADARSCPRWWWPARCAAGRADRPDGAAGVLDARCRSSSSSRRNCWTTSASIHAAPRRASISSAVEVGGQDLASAATLASHRRRPSRAASRSAAASAAASLARTLPDRYSGAGISRAGCGRVVEHEPAERGAGLVARCRAAARPRPGRTSPWVSRQMASGVGGGVGAEPWGAGRDHRLGARSWPCGRCRWWRRSPPARTRRRERVGAEAALRWADRAPAGPRR